MLNKRILKPAMSARPAVGIRDQSFLSPGPLCDMEMKTKALMLDDEGENMGSPKRREIGNCTPDERVVHIWGYCLRFARIVFLGPCSSFQNSFSTTHPVIS